MEQIFISILFVFGYIVVPILGLTLMRLSGISLRYISIPFIFFLYYLVSAYFGIIAMYFGWNTYWINIGVVDRNLVLIVFLYSSISLLLICSSFLFSFHVLNFKPAPHHPMDCSISSFGVCLNLTVIFICMVVSFLYIIQLPGIPIMAALSGDTTKIAELRSLATNAFAGKHHRYGMFMYSLLPFCTMIIYSDALQKHSVKYWILLIPIILFTSFILLVTTEKGPILFFFVSLLFTYLVTRGNKIHLRFCFFSGVLGMAMLLPMYMIFMGLSDRTLIEIFSAIASRVFGDIVPAYFYFDMIPDTVDYLAGKTFPNPAGIIPDYTPYRITVEVANFIRPELIESGIVGSAPTAFWVELYANFGHIGFLIFTPIIGIIIYSFHYFSSYLPASPIKAALIVWLGLHLMKLATCMLNHYIVDLHLVMIISISFIYLLFEGKGRIRILKSF